MPLELSDSDAKLIAKHVAAEIKSNHQCRFDDDEASVVHGFRRALKEHGAGEKEIFIVIQLGKTLTEFVEGLSRKVIWMIIAGSLFAICGMSSHWKFWIFK